MDKLARITSEESNVNPFFKQFDVIIITHSNAGGSENNRKIFQKTQKVRYEGIGEVGFEMISEKSSNNNCLFAVFNQFYEIKGNEYPKLPTDIREKLGMAENTMIDYKHIPAISEYYNTKFDKKYGYILVDNRGKFINLPDGLKITDSLESLKNTVVIGLNGEHYYSVCVKGIDKKETCEKFGTTILSKSMRNHVCKQICNKCGTKLLPKTMENHQCNPSKVSHRDVKHFRKRRFIIPSDKKKKQPEINYEKDIVSWDIETSAFPDEFQNSGQRFPSFYMSVDDEENEFNGFEEMFDEDNGKTYSRLPFILMQVECWLMEIWL